MTTIGLIPLQELVSLSQDEEGNWLDMPKGQAVVPLVKLDKPAVSPGIDFAPKIVWFEDRVERQWEQVTVSIPTPEPVTMCSFRLACGRALWSSIEAVVAGMQDADMQWEAQQFLEYSPTVNRSHPFVNSLAAALGKTSTTVDALFVEAKRYDLA